MLNAYFSNAWHTGDDRADRGFAADTKRPEARHRSGHSNAARNGAESLLQRTCRPYGLRWFAGVPIWAGPALWGLSIQRTPQEGPFEANDKLVLAQLSRPLIEIASLSAAVGRISLSSATNALNAVRQPAIAIDRLGFVLDANPAADALFDENIRRSNSRLVVGDAGDAEAGICLKKLTDRLRITPIRRRSPVSRSSFADERKVPSSCASCRFTVPHELRFSARGCFSRLRPSSPSMGQTRLCSEEPAG
jgi:hypothetical protein